MQVGTQDAALDTAFGVVLAIVAKAHAHASKGLGFRPEIRAAAVILETHQGGRLEVRQVGVDDHVADEATLAGFGAHVDHADAGEPGAIAGLVVVTEQLVAATDGEHARAPGHRALEWSLFGLQQVFVDERLLAVLAAAEKEDIDVVYLIRAFGGATAQLDEPRVVIAPFGALEQGDDVAAIPI